MIDVSDWVIKIMEDQEMREPKLYREAKQIFSAEADTLI